MSLSNFVTTYPPKPYKFFEIFFSFSVKLQNLSCIYTTLWKELIRKSLFAYFQECHRNRKLFRVFLIVCKLNSTYLDITEKLPALFNLPFTFVHQ